MYLNESNIWRKIHFFLVTKSHILLFAWVWYLSESNICCCRNQNFIISMGLIFPTFAGGEIWANLWFLKHWSRLHKDPARPPVPPCKVELSWLFGVRATTRTSCDNCCVQLPAPKLLYTSPNPEIHPFHPTLYPPYPTIQLESRKCFTYPGFLIRQHQPGQKFAWKKCIIIHAQYVTK